MNLNSLNAERGNVLFLILIAVVLFAALGFTVSGIMRGGDANMITEEKAQLLANEVLDYGRSLRQETQNLRINGCDDTDISFENPVVGGYVNGTNTDCQLFHSDGGGLVWVPPATNINDGSNWIYVGTNHVSNLGTAAPELVMILRNINSNVCTQINDISGISALGSDAGVDFTQFSGTYAATQVIDSAGDSMFGCLNHDNGGTDESFFYQVLVVR